MPNSSPDSPTELTVGRLLVLASEQLAREGIDTPDLDARLLIRDVLGLDRLQLMLQTDRILTDEEKKRISLLIGRRTKHESVARIQGFREFWKLSFDINEATLEPRPDSETLIETALNIGWGIVQNSLKRATDKPALKPDARILDIGTGSGCLLLSLLHELPKASGLGFDIAPRAIEQAQKNAEKLGLSERCKFRQNNWIDDLTEKFDLVISNPPYIADKVIPALSPEVRNFDPLRALSGGVDGLDAYRHLVPALSRILKPYGLAVFEIGFDQGDTVQAIFKQTGFATECFKDLGGNDRCVVAWIA